ncbi:MAG: class I SAM-dependent RNA methyltransferase [Gemmatimonadetes bacterium]|nr:class I SAM-dependent RNA methyltransferase [Gemmatimonadota bacterium]
MGHLADGRTVFVPRTAPGDRVLLTAIRRRRRHAHAAVAEVLVPAAGRAAPPCVHFVREQCGGCQWQHLSAEVQAAAKRRIVGDALRRLAGLDLADPELVPSPRRLGYRATITLSVRHTGAAPVVGFHAADEAGMVFPLDRCEIAREEINALWRALQPATRHLPSGRDVRLKLRVAPDGALHLIVGGGEGGEGGVWSSAEPLAAAAAAAGLQATVWWQPRGAVARRMAGPPADPGAMAFEQVNAEVAALLREAVIEAAEAVRRSDGQAVRVLDLYAGAGDTALPLAERGYDVAMVEMDLRAVRRAHERAKAKGLQLRCIAARVEDRLTKLLPADVVIVNPPRTGLSSQVADRLAAGPPVRLIYVSCNPATLARDLKRLHLATAAIVAVRAYDMFPQTSHVETLVVAEPEPAEGREGRG